MTAWGVRPPGFLLPSTSQTWSQRRRLLEMPTGTDEACSRQPRARATQRGTKLLHNNCPTSARRKHGPAHTHARLSRGAPGPPLGLGSKEVGWGGQDFQPQQPGMRPLSFGSLETCGESRLLPELGTDEASRVLSEEAS